MTALMVQQPADLDGLLKLAAALAKSAVFADARMPERALVKILAGAELGFSPMASLSGVHFIDGKPVIGANLMAAAIKRSSYHDYEVVELTRERCSLVFTVHQKKAGTVTLTMEDIKATGLHLGKDQKEKANWKKHPDDMLFARAISKGFRRYCPDLTGGMTVYVPDEMELDDSELVRIQVEQQAKVDPPTPAAPKAVEAQPAPAPAKPDRHKLMDEIDVHQNRLGLKAEPFKDRLRQKYGTDSASSLTDEQLLDLREKLAAVPTPQPKEGSAA